LLIDRTEQTLADLESAIKDKFQKREQQFQHHPNMHQLIKPILPKIVSVVLAKFDTESLV
jgi:hypothetical protein